MADDKIKNVKEYQAQLEQIKNRLADIQKLEDKGLQSAISKKETQKEIVKLQAKINNEIAQQNKNARTFKSIQDDVGKQQKNISKSLLGSVAALLKGNAAESQTLASKIQQSKTQTDLSKQAAVQAGTLKDMRLDNLLSAKDYAKMLDLTTGLKDGTIDRLDIEDNLAGLSEEGYQNAQDLRGTLDDIGKQKEEEVKLIEEAEEAEERRVKRQAVFNGLAGAGVAIFGAVLAMAKKFATMVDSIGQEFGSLNVLGEEFQGDLLASSVEAQKLGGGLADVSAITSTLASNFGISLDTADSLSAKVFDTSKAIGLSADEGANLFGVLMQTANLSAKQAEDLAEGAFQLARQAGVAPQAVMKDIAGSAEEIAVWTKDGGENIAEAAVQARQMGLSLSTTAKIAEGLLDFESSIAGEVEASVLIGRQLNFQKARELALSGDIAGATKDIVAQLGSEAEFNALNLIQRQALAKSIGVSVSELSKMVGQVDKLTLSGALAAGSFDDMFGQNALSNLSKITNEVKALFTEALVLIGPEIEKMVGGFRTWLKESGGIEALKGMFLGVASGIKSVIGWIPALIGLMVSLKAASIAAAIAATIHAIAVSSVAFPFSLGTTGLVTAAAIIGAGLMVRSALSVDDFKSGPGGITHMSGPAGSFSLNPRDSVLATTNPIPVNDITTAPAGALGNMSKMEGLLEGILGATSSERTIVTDSQVKRISYTGGLGGREIPAYS